MKHRRALFTSIWIVAIGVILAISSAFPYNDFQIPWAHGLSVGLQWSGAVVFTLGIFAFVITFLNEYLDRDKKVSQKERKTVET